MKRAQKKLQKYFSAQIDFQKKLFAIAIMLFLNHIFHCNVKVIKNLQIGMALLVAYSLVYHLNIWIRRL